MKTYLIDGGKGGVGKTMQTSILLDAIQHFEKGSVFLIDADPSNPDVGKAYSNADYVNECAYINLDNKEGFLDLVDGIQRSKADYCIINSPARASGWLEYGNLLIDNLDEIGTTFKVLWVLSRQRDSIEALIAFKEALPSVLVIPVINTYWGSVDSFELWNTSNTRQSLLKDGIKEIVLPSVADRVTDAMRQYRRRWDDENDIPLSHKLESRRFRTAAYAALESIL